MNVGSPLGMPDNACMPLALLQYTLSVLLLAFFLT